MQIELETRRLLHIVDQGFAWYYEIKDNPDFPTEAITIEEYQDKKLISSLNVNRKALPSLIKLLEKTCEDYV